MAESAHGTAIPPEARIVDSVGVTWMLSAGRVYRNAVLQNTAAVNLLVYVTRVVYRRNVSGTWYKWTNSQWRSTKPPVLTPAPDLPVGETKVELYDDDKLVARGKLVSE